MAAILQIDQPDADVANKVLRRAQVSKVRLYDLLNAPCRLFTHLHQMTRALQDRLALANVKIRNGWENIPLDALEPQIDERLRHRKRTASSSNNDTISDTASTTSSRMHSSLASSPLTAPMLFSDEAFQRSGSSYSHKKSKRNISLPLQPPRPASAVPTTTGRRTRLASQRQASWKKTHALPESSPIKHTKHARFNTSTTNLSFISETPTIPDSPPSPLQSEDDDQGDIPITSFTASTIRHAASSPPHTPPPQDRRMLRKAAHHNIPWSRTPRTGAGAEDADLLMYLAASPSPLKSSRSSHTQPNVNTAIKVPTTPPHKSTPLPSSHMTPGMSGAGLFGPHTPGTTGAGGFKFEDFVNVTPSPAQGVWGGRTPGMRSEARRKLNFDAPPTVTSSPVVTRSARKGVLKMEMDLGGEL